MRLLVDSHVLLWHLSDDPRLGPKATEAIQAPDAEVLVSAASLWEIAIKVGLGKLKAPDDLPERIGPLGFQQLNVTTDDVWRVRRLPHHHGDPFDRVLIAQAQARSLCIVTGDLAFADYDVCVLWD
ncbi:MAG TPA: type II toxin-antitoxin system VapC family toxin [Solirubrobacteraceae bacterium]|nr:type II toxin-antitoxin system VapC family toxin [Solirubrobacteraceae bacterium]